MNTLTFASLLPILPILVMSSAAVLLMLLVSFYRSHGTALLFSLAAVVISLVCALPVENNVPVEVTGLLSVGVSTHFYWALILLSTLVCIGISYDYIKPAASLREEWYLLLMIAATGGMVLVSSQHLVALFIGLELMSVPLYGLVAFSLKNKRSLEAGIKYLVLSGAASAFLAFGMALVYADTGSLLMADWAIKASVESPLVVLGCALILIGLGFKLSWVPFHTWTPDVYQGAPMPVTAFLATASKVAVVAALVKLFEMLPIWKQHEFSMLLSIIAGASILLGNLLAIGQESLKRLLAYSSIAHFGYLMIALIAVPERGSEAVWIYLATYVITSLGAFAVLSSLTTIHCDDKADAFDALRGLNKRSPFLAVVLALNLVSMAGIPLTAGFIGKFAVFAAGVNMAQWALLVIAVVGSAIGVYYYLRAVSVLFQSNVESTERVAVAPLNGALIAVLAIATVLIGVWPDVLI